MSVSVFTEDALDEFVDGQRVEKAMGCYGAGIACVLAEFLALFVRGHKIDRVRGSLSEG